MAADWRIALELFLLIVYRTHHVYQIYLISYLCCIIQDFRLVTRDSHGDLYSTYYSPVQVCWLLTKTWEIRLDQPIWLLLSSIELLVHPSYYDTETMSVSYSAIRKKLSRCANHYAIIQFLMNVTVSIYDFIQILDELCDIVSILFSIQDIHLMVDFIHDHFVKVCRNSKFITLISDLIYFVTLTKFQTSSCKYV